MTASARGAAATNGAARADDEAHHVRRTEAGVENGIALREAKRPPNLTRGGDQVAHEWA